MNNTRPPSGWLGRPAPNPEAALRLFCFPYAGGTSLIYRAWPKLLPRAIEVCAVQLPGRGERLSEPAYTNIADLVRALADALLLRLDKPFALFGHSMGALISFELARELRRRAAPPPLHLFVSGRRAPQIERSRPPTYDLPDEEFLLDLRRLNGTPLEVLEHPELMRLLLPLLRADFAVCQTYVYSPEPPLDCPITAFGGLHDGGVPREHVEAWREQTAAAFSVRMLPGDHFFLRTQQHPLLDILSRRLGQLTSAPP
jgi:medium-chain acyl-[acyl-carrier-protein] hydrolase